MTARFEIIEAFVRAGLPSMLKVPAKLMERYLNETHPIDRANFEPDAFDLAEGIVMVLYVPALPRILVTVQPMTIGKVEA